MFTAIIVMIGVFLGSLTLGVVVMDEPGHSNELCAWFFTISVAALISILVLLACK